MSWRRHKTTGDKPVAQDTTARKKCTRCGRLLPELNGICPACLSRWDTFRRIASYLRPHRKGVALLIAASFLISLAALLPPVVTGQIIDRVLLPANDAGPVSRHALLLLLVGGLLVIRLISWGAEWVHGRTVAWVGASITADIRREIFHRLETLSLRFFSKRDVGSLIARVTRDAGALQDFLIRGLPYTIVNLTTFVGILCFLFWLHWKLALCIAATIPAILFWAFYFWRRMTHFYQTWWQAGSQFSSHVNETLAGNRITKMFRRESDEIEKFGNENRRLLRTSLTTAQKRAALLAATGLVSTVGITILWLYGGREVQQGRLTPGTLVAFYGYLLLFYGPIQWLGQLSNWMTQAFTAAAGIFEILDAGAGSVEQSGSIGVPTLEGHITFRNVHFAYDAARPILRGIDLEVHPGEFLGIVGRSGVGKTTLMHLLCRFYDPDEGLIEVDRMDVRQFRLRDLRRKIGVVPQEPFLFSGTIAENIRYGKPEANLAEVVAAARMASAHEFIVQRTDGYDAYIGEGGKGLSQGEKQRIALARCLVCDPKIVILDEATSAVDPISERAVQRATDQMRRNRTTLVIAHRLSTLQIADRIVVIEGGRIQEEGSYQGLIQRQGTFASLVKLQHEAPDTLSIED